MAEKDTVYSSKMKYGGIFNFKDLYSFCYTWLSEETGLSVAEEEYSEKISGQAKNIDIKWVGEVEVSDYFKFQVKIEFKFLNVTPVEVNQGGKTVKTNKGDITMKVKGVLVKDYEGKFETTARMKIWRTIYEKWMISGRVKEFEDKLAGACDEYLGQTKAFLDISGR